MSGERGTRLRAGPTGRSRGHCNGPIRPGQPTPGAVGSVRLRGVRHSREQRLRFTRERRGVNPPWLACHPGRPAQGRSFIHEHGSTTLSELNGSSILITGGTGSFGRTFLRHMLDDLDPERVMVFSRDELKQYELRQQFDDDPRLRWFIGDVRDRHRLPRAMHGVDYVVHAAALKQVDTAEYNPFEYVADQHHRLAERGRRGDRRRRQEGHRALHRQGVQPDQPVRRHQAGRRQAVRLGQPLRRRRTRPASPWSATAT